MTWTLRSASDDEDSLAFLPFDHGLLRHDHGIRVLADDHAGPNIFDPARAAPSGFGTAARTRNVEVVVSTMLSMKMALPTCGCMRSPSTVKLTFKPVLRSAVATGRYRAGGRKSNPIGSSCWMVTSSVAWPSPTRLPTLTFNSPMRPSMGAYILQ